MMRLYQRLLHWLRIGNRPQRRLLLSQQVQSSRPVPAMAPPTVPTPPDISIEMRRKALYTAFNPSRPVDAPEDLAGRDREIATLVSAVFAEQSHAIIHGARGSGKTSIARVFGTQADERGIVAVYLACDATSSFAALLAPYLAFVPAMAVPKERERGFREQIEALGSDFGPRELVSVLAEISTCRLLFILDEFDRIVDRKLQEDVATFMKLLSDAHVPLQLIVVGIAGNVRELIGLHPSLRRHLVAIGVQRISEDSVRALITRGSKRSGVTFDDEAIRVIESASAGSPYHVRLFCHHAGLVALARSSDVVDESAAIQGLAAAVDRWAALNEEDSTLFRSLAADKSAHELLYGIAVQAAVDDGLATPVGAVPHGLGDALIEDARTVGRSLFRDSLAPQFLIATLILAERRHVDMGDIS